MRATSAEAAERDQSLGAAMLLDYRELSLPGAL